MRMHFLEVGIGVYYGGGLKTRNQKSRRSKASLGSELVLENGYVGVEDGVGIASVVLVDNFGADIAGDEMSAAEAEHSAVLAAGTLPAEGMQAVVGRRS